MKTTQIPKAKKAKLIGSSYFALLGLVNFAATFIYSTLRPLDLVILTLGFLPLLIHKKAFLLAFGILAACISLYMGLAGILFNLNPRVETSQMAFLMGYLLAGSCLFSALLLIYAGVQSSGSPGKNKLSMA